MSQALSCPDEFSLQLIEITTADIAYLHPFEVIPDALIGVEIRGIAGKLFEVEAASSPFLEKVFDLMSAMNGCSIPDDHNLAANLAQENAQEAHDRLAIIGSRAYLQEESSIGGDAADGGEVVAGQRHAQDRCLPSWCPGAHRHRQQIKPGFVYPDDGGLLLLGFFLMAGQRCSFHCLMASSLRGLARSIGSCRLQPACRKSRPT